MEEGAVEAGAGIEERPARWEGFGWPVAPGSLVRLQVSNLELLFDRIGEQLQRQQGAIDQLNSTVAQQQETIISLQSENNEYRSGNDERLLQLEQRLGDLSITLNEAGQGSDGGSSLKLLKQYHSSLVQGSRDDVSRHSSQLARQVEEGNAAVQGWNSQLDELNLEEAEGDTDKLKTLLQQWSAYHRDVDSRVQEALASRRLVQDSLHRLGEVEGKQPFGKDGEDGEATATAAPGGDDGGDDGDDGEDGQEGGAGAAAARSAAGAALGGVDDLVNASHAARDRLALLLSSFTVGHTTYVTKTLKETTVKNLDEALGNMRSEFDGKLDTQHDDHVKLVKTSVDRLRTEFKGRPRSPRPDAAAPVAVLPEHIEVSHSNIVTKKDFDLVVKQLELVTGQAKANASSVMDNSDRLEATEGEVSRVAETVPPVEAGVTGLRNDTEQMQLTINKLERAILDLQSFTPAPVEGEGPSEAALRGMQQQLVAHSSHIEDLFDKLRNLPEQGGNDGEESKALTDEIRRTLDDHASKLSSILTRQAEAETSLANQIKRKASLSGLQNVAHEVSRKVDEAKMSVALQDKIGRELLNKLLDDYMASLDKRLDAMCNTVRDERQSEVGDLKRRFQRLLRDAIAKALEGHQLGAGGVDPGSKSRFGRVKLQFCAGCDRPVSQIVGVPVPTVPHQRLPAPHNVTDDFVYRGGGFRVPSRQQRLAAQEEAMRDSRWGDSSPSRPRSAARSTRRKHDHGATTRPRMSGGRAWDEGRPSTAPQNEHGSHRTGRSSSAMDIRRGAGEAGHSSALLDTPKKRSMAQGY